MDPAHMAHSPMALPCTQHTRPTLPWPSCGPSTHGPLSHGPPVDPAHTAHSPMALPCTQPTWPTLPVAGPTAPWIGSSALLRPRLRLLWHFSVALRCSRALCLVCFAARGIACLRGAFSCCVLTRQMNSRHGCETYSRGTCEMRHRGPVPL